MVTIFLDSGECCGEWILSMNREYLKSALILVNGDQNGIRAAVPE